MRACVQVGILPTDTFPAFVCDLDNRDAVQRLYQIKGLPASQPLSILCASFRNISEYTQVTNLDGTAPLANHGRKICAHTPRPPVQPLAASL